MDAEQLGARAYPRCLTAGDQALLVELGDTISPALNLQVRRLCAAVQRAVIPGVIDLHPAYASVLIRFDPLRLRRPALLQLLTRALATVTAFGR